MVQIDMEHEKLKQIAIEYLENDISINDLAKKHGMSKTTLIRYFNGERKTLRLNKDLQILIDEERKKRFLSSKSTYGNKGYLSLTKDEIISLANYYVENDDINLEELALFKDVSKETIYNNFTLENLGEELYNAVLKKYELNHKNTFKR